MTTQPTFQETVAPAHTAVVVVDVQNDYIHSDGAQARSGNDVGAAQAVVPNILTFVECARAAGVRVVWVRTEHTAWSNAEAWLNRQRHRKRDLRRFPVCVPGTWGAEFYAVEPEDGEPIVTKHRYSGFLNTDLDLLLRSQEIRTVVLVGVATNVCVESTAREAAMRNYRTVVLSDGTAAYSEEQHRSSLQTLDQYFGYVTTADELYEAWGIPHSPDHPRRTAREGLETVPRP